MYWCRANQGQIRFVNDLIPFFTLERKRLIIMALSSLDARYFV